MKDQRRFAPITGRLELEWVAGFKRNRRPTSSGLHGRLHRNAQPIFRRHLSVFDTDTSDTKQRGICIATRHVLTS